MLSDYSFWLYCQGESDLYDQFVETIQINNRSDDALGAQLDVCPFSFFFFYHKSIIIIIIFIPFSLNSLVCLAGTLESFIRLCGLHRCQSPSKDSLWGKIFYCFTVASTLDLISIILCLQIFGMSLWDHKPHVMDALVDLIISLVHKLNNHSLSC